MKKSTFLGLALLFCAANGQAQQTISSLDDLKAAKTALENLADKTEQLNALKVDLANAKSQLGNAENVTSSVSTEYHMPYGGDAKNALKTFCDAFNDAVLGKDVDAKIRCCIETTGEGMAANTTLHILPLEDAPKGATPKDEYSTQTFAEYSSDLNSKLIEKNASNFKNASVSGTDFTSGNTITEYKVYYLKVENTGVDKPKYVWKVISGKLSGATTNVEIYNTLAYTVYNAIPEGEDFWTKTTQQTGDQKLINHWTNEITKINGKINEVQLAIGAAEAYKNMVLTNDVTINESFSLGEWGSGYYFDGGKNVITYTGDGVGSNLFTSNAGTIQNLGVVGGKIAASNTKTIRLSFCNGEGDTYNVYDNGGAVSYNVENNREMGYAYRAAFGYDIANSKLTFDSKYKVYKGSYATADNKTAVPFYANITDKGLEGFTTADDVFYYMEDTDAKNILSGKNIANVVYKGLDGSYVCNFAKISDKPVNGIYVPTSFVATTLNYDRTINADYATVCLPFNVPGSYINEIIGRSATYSNSIEEGQLLQFNNVDAETNTFWFKYRSGDVMNANQPYVVKFSKAKVDAGACSLSFSGMTNVQFIATPSGNSAALAPEAQGQGGEFYGTFVKRTANELGSSDVVGIYGYSKGKFVRALNTATFQPGRAYVLSDVVPANPAKAFDMKFMDEAGNEVTGIETVEKPSAVFSVKGGNGAIIVNSDKAQNIKVYTTGGALVKSAMVEAGEISIPVTAGLYIVNGNKVVVK